MSKISSFFRKKKKNKNSKDYIQPLGDYPDFQQFQGKIFQISIQKLASTYATSRKNIPLIIKQLIDMIEESYIRKKGLFNTPKNFELLNEKVLLLNENGALNTLSIRDPNVLTSLLKLIFYYLPDPLLTSKLIEKWTAAEDVETISKIIEILPEVNQFVLAYLMRFLKRVSLESKFNKLNSNSLAEIFAPLIIWGEDRSSTVENSPFVVEKMISYYNKLFKEVEAKSLIKKSRIKKSIPTNKSKETGDFVSLLDDLDLKYGKLTKSTEMIKISSREIISMDIKNLLRLPIPKKKTLKSIKSINQEKQKKKEQEIKTQEIKRENENEKSSDDEGSDSSSDSSSSEDNKPKMKVVRKVRFSLFVEQFGDNKEKKQKEKEILEKRNLEQKEFKEYEREQKKEEKKFKEIIEKSKKENQKNKKKDKDKKKKKGKGKGERQRKTKKQKKTKNHHKKKKKVHQNKTIKNKHRNEHR
ncbi:rho gtpase-activating protein [Anaeramoeba flamelloides]|uniref:Rho gtpase-activating protein n=1 Tax=Anaeramoeba flamelloides TaxID=1746091 RepID=A0AAV8A9L6_9EUKA|nr:rho gtpase-activating protein [Anaeramoeba flamelloides]